MLVSRTAVQQNSYKSLLADGGRLVAFGFLLCFFSSFGQTYFIGVFGGVLRAEFALTDGEYGGLYSLATFGSGVTLLLIGHTLDRFDLRAYSVLVCCGLALACGGLSFAIGPFTLVCALLLLRLTGQGLMSHIAMTSMARYFDAHRAKSISLAGLGFALGEVVWPRTATALLDSVEWRTLWLAIAGVVCFAAIPGVWLTLRGHDSRALEVDAQRAASSKGATGDAPQQRQWTRGEVVRDPCFYMLLPLVLAPAILVTGLFFHQVRLIELKSWTLSWYTTCFGLFAGVKLAIGLFAGPIVDRYSGTRLLPCMLLPVSLGLIVLAQASGALACLAYLVLLGVTAGSVGALTGAVWAESYGVLHLGAIRALTTGSMVFGTSLAPVFVGALLDLGASVAQIAWLGVAYCAGATILAIRGCRRLAARVATAT